MMKWYIYYLSYSTIIFHRWQRFSFEVEVVLVAAKSKDVTSTFFISWSSTSDDPWKNDVVYSQIKVREETQRLLIITVWRLFFLFLSFTTFECPPRMSIIIQNNRLHYRFGSTEYVDDRSMTRGNWGVDDDVDFWLTFWWLMSSWSNEWRVVNIDVIGDDFEIWRRFLKLVLNLEQNKRKP